MIPKHCIQSTGISTVMNVKIYVAIYKFAKESDKN